MRDLAGLVQTASGTVKAKDEDAVLTTLFTLSLTITAIEEEALLIVLVKSDAVVSR